MLVPAKEMRSDTSVSSAAVLSAAEAERGALGHLMVTHYLMRGQDGPFPHTSPYSSVTPPLWRERKETRASALPPPGFPAGVWLTPDLSWVDLFGRSGVSLLPRLGEEKETVSCVTPRESCSLKVILLVFCDEGSERQEVKAGTGGVGQGSSSVFSPLSLIVYFEGK